MSLHSLRTRLSIRPISHMPPRRYQPPHKRSNTSPAPNPPPRARLSAGDELEGRVSRIVPFGAFVDLGAEGSGLVHISEIADSFISDVSAHLSEGDVVRVRVLSVDQSNSRVSLSIKQSTAAVSSGYDRVVELGGDWGHPWNDDGEANFADLGPRPKGPEIWEPDPELFREWEEPKE